MKATIVGAFPVLAGAARESRGHDPIAPDANPSHAADTLSMMLGRKPTRREVAALTLFRHGVRPTA